MRKAVVIGLCGPAGCGKDALADFLALNEGYEKIRFAHFLYRMIYQLPFLEEHRWHDRNWKESVHPFYGVSPRRMLQTLGTEWGRDLVNTDMWVKLAQWTVESRFSKRFFVFPDLRFANEANWLRTIGGLSVRIQRPDPTSIKGSNERLHISEHSSFNVDVHITNDRGLQDLKDQAANLHKEAYKRANSR